MKKLYNCSAEYSTYSLISYNTEIINFNCEEYLCVMRNYRSNTTLMHVRKYIKKLREEGFNGRGNIVQALYDYASKQKYYKYIVMDITRKIIGFIGDLYE